MAGRVGLSPTLLAVVQEIDSAGAAVYYIREPDGSLIARAVGSNLWYYHFDQLGSTRLITDSAGAVTDKYDYDAYGAVLWHERGSGSIYQPYQYVGRFGYYTHYQEPGMGLLQLGVRFYDPASMAFTQVDPIGPRGAINAYAYVVNRPTVKMDPQGLTPCSVINTQEAFRLGCVGLCESLLKPSLHGTKVGTKICNGICTAWTYKGAGSCLWLAGYCAKLHGSPWYGPCDAVFSVMCLNGNF